MSSSSKSSSSEPFSSDVLSQLSVAMSARAEAAKTAVVAINLGEGRHLTGTAWQPGVIVVSEQALPRGDDFELVVAGGSTVAAKLAGRDASTNIAILKTAETIVASAFTAAEPHVGALALAIGADGTGGASARLGAVNLVSGEWHSLRGGLIDRRIVLDIQLASRRRRPRLRRRRRSSRHIDFRAARTGHRYSVRDPCARGPATRQRWPCRARLAWCRAARRRRARRVARERRSIERDDGDVGRGEWPGRASGNRGRRYHPQCRRHRGQSFSKDCPLFRRR